MNRERTHSNRIFRKLISLLLIAVMLLSVVPVYAEEKDAPQEKTPYKGSLSLKLGVHGFGKASALLEFLNFTLGIDTEMKAADLKISLFSKSIDIVFAWDENSLRFSVPEAGKEVYELGKDLVGELFGIVKDLIKAVDPAKLASDAGDFLMDKFTELVYSAAAAGHGTDEEAVIRYELLGSSAQGRMYTATLSMEQWRSFWKQVTAILAENSEFIGELADKTGILPKQITDELTPTEENLDELAEKTKDWQLRLFYDNDTVHAFYLSNATSGILFEKTGSVSNGGRTAALGLRLDGKINTVLTNTMEKTEKGFFGKMKILGLLDLSYSVEAAKGENKKIRLDLSYEDKGISLEGTYMPGSVRIAVPGTPDETIYSVNELIDVIGKVLQKALSQLRIF